MYEGILGRVLRFLRGPQHAHKGMVQAILVADHQFPERLRPSGQAFGNEVLVGRAHCVLSLDARGRAKVPPFGPAFSGPGRRPISSGHCTGGVP
jgi:hypothetical protein